MPITFLSQTTFAERIHSLSLANSHSDWDRLALDSKAYGGQFLQEGESSLTRWDEGRVFDFGSDVHSCLALVKSFCDGLDLEMHWWLATAKTDIPKYNA
jgi:hypothetical protein